MLAAAREKVVEMGKHDECKTPDWQLASVIVDCTEAIVRQIRDHDDTQATVIAPAIREGLADLGVIIGGRG